MTNREIAEECIVGGGEEFWAGQTVDAIEAALDQKDAERDRLREALKLIAAQDQGCGGNVTEAEAWRSVQAIARAALGANP